MTNKAINVIFDGPPGPVTGRFIEVETDDGRSINAGEWIDRGDGTWALRITALPVAEELRPKITVHFSGGPWSRETYEVERVVGPVFAVGHEIGNHYWLDTKSEPPRYVWDGGASGGKVSTVSSGNQTQDTGGLDGVTLTDLGFHWQANIFWKRTGDGFVRVCLARNRLDGSDLYDMVWAYSIDPDSWASIVASVCAEGETGATFEKARTLHNSPKNLARFSVTRGPDPMPGGPLPDPFEDEGGSDRG